MSKIISKDCQKALDMLISEDSAKNATADIIGHAVTCPDCHALIDAVSSIRAHGSLYAGEKHLDLKNRILQKINTETQKPVINTVSREETFVNPLTRYLPVWLRFSLSFAIIMGIVIYLLSTFSAQNQIPIKANKNEIVTASIKSNENNLNELNEEDYYTVSFNGSKSEQMHIDEPVTLLNNEIASVVLPDGSKAVLHGTAKLVIHPRGFHLAEGKIEINVSKSNKQFAATTPHGRIVVFGTSFSVDVSKLETDVYVKAGQVRVTPDRGKGTILNSKEYFVMKKKKQPYEYQMIVPRDAE